ncbi:transaldolase [Ilumatobacter sp.]|uniref:transaldolase n=1 Tax=Ilumatobacter sp. TaxID=1967498 RepID=UPI003B521155
MSDRLQNLYDEQGQSPWLDNLRRDYLTSGELVELRDGGVRGLTSNPSIFQKAISGSDDYDDQFREMSGDDPSTEDVYWAMVVQDIHGACDVFSKVYDHSDGTDGFVSVEVAPDLAHDSAGTESAARELHQRIDRRNLMVKIPGTEAGLGPIEAMIAEGRNVNVTLIFSLPRYEQVIEAYIAGIEKFAGDPDAELSSVASVASFFISRVDVEVDARLEEIGTDDALALRGKAAVAQGKLAYDLFRQKFSGERWDPLAERGARVQRPLWASTSTKNDDYPDTLYVDELIGPDTVNTLPDSTIEAFVDHGTVERTVDRGVDEARAVWSQLAEVGVDMDDVAAQLEREGVESFAEAFDELIETLAGKAAEMRD